MADKIIKILPSDVISESMDKINQNFDILEQSNEINEFSIQNYAKSISDKIDELKKHSDTRDGEIIYRIDEINDRIASIPTWNQSNFVRNEELNNYVKSSAFVEYETDSNKKFALLQMGTANSTFLRDANGNFVLASNGTSSEFSSIEEYFDSLDTNEQAEIDPNNKGLNDADVYNNLIQKCSTVFKTVYTEMATIRTEVTTGTSSTAIVNMVQTDGGNIVSAIFSEANKEGSTITLDANNIKIISDNFKVNAGGNHTVEVNGKITATSGSIGGIIVENNSIHSSSNKFSVSSDGTLVATNATISGNIEMESEYPVNVTKDNKTYTGDITKTTLIKSNEFSIKANGTFYENNGSGTIVLPADGTNSKSNSLYFTILNQVEDSTGAIISGGGYLYGVPTLCMYYDNKQYVLDPRSWKLFTGSNGNTSNMRWLRDASVIKYSVNTSELGKTTNRSYIINDDNNNYLFRHDNINRFISGYTNNDTVCKLRVESLGGEGYESTASQLLNQYQLYDGRTYGLDSVINDAYIGIYEDTKTQILDSSCQTYQGYKANCSVGIENRKIASGNSISSSSTVWKMYKWLTSNFLRNNDSSMWHNDNSSSDTGYYISNYDNKLPFENDTIYTHSDEYYSWVVYYYPLVTISNGLYPTLESIDGVDTVLAKCSFSVHSDYSNYPGWNERHNRFYLSPNDSSPYDPDPDRQFLNPTEITLELNFDMILQNVNTSYDPSSGNKYDVDTDLMNAINQYVKNFAFDNRIYSNTQVECKATIEFDNDNTYTLTTYERP